jgi:EmrB/QacA subfamily drug resistance transporter
MSVATAPRPATSTAALPQQPFSMRSIAAPLAAIVLGSFMAILDVTVVNVALPTLGRVFKTDLSVLQWVITGYMLAQAAVVPLSGWFSDRFGAKRVYLSALTLFTLGSVLCAFAWSGESLAAFRVIQGLGGGMLMPVGMAFNYRLAPPEKRGQVMGMIGIPMLLGPALGPVLSGWLLEYAGWQLIFLINLPVGALALLVGLRALPSLPAPHRAGSLDVLGVILGPLAFASLSYGISESTTSGWTGAPTLIGIGVGAVALAAFVARELTAKHPLLELRVFRSRDFSLAIVTQWAGFAGLFGTMFLVPLFLQQVRNYGSFDTGLYTLPQALTAAAFMPVGGRIFDRFGARATVMPGLALVAAAQWLLAEITPGAVGVDMRLALALQGAGMGLLMMPLGTHILNSAPRHLVSRVTSLTGAFQNVVASLAVATWATLLQSRAPAHVAELAAGGLPTLQLQQSALALAFGDVYHTSMLTIAAAFVLAIALRRRPAAVAVHERQAVPEAAVA